MAYLFNGGIEGLVKSIPFAVVLLSMSLLVAGELQAQVGSGASSSVAPGGAQEVKNSVGSAANNSTIASVNDGFGEGGVWPTAGRSPRTRAGTDWFPRNSVRDLGSKPELQSAGEIKYFLERPDRPEAAAPSPQVAAAQPSTPQSPESLPAENTRDGMIARFGDPSKDAPVLAKSDAPKPFQGLMAALENGDRELAQGYARQYVRYVRNIQERSTKALSLQGVAMAQEGMLDEAKEKNWPILPEERSVLAAQRENQNLFKAEQLRMATLDPMTQGLLREAEQAENIAHEAFPKESVKRASKEEVAGNETALRAQVRKEFASRVTVDPKHRADLFLFIRIKDAKSAAQAREVEKLYRKYVESDNVNVMALNLDVVMPDEVKLFRRQVKASFPIKEGANLARALGVKGVPTVAVIAPTTGNAIFLENFRSAVEIDEILRMTMGGE